MLSEAESADIAGRILYEDNHLLVFNKRAGEIVQGDKTGDEPLSETLKAFIAGRDGKPGQVFMGVPHRLDRPVSGVTVFAKTSKALERMSELFREGAAHKIYWALSGNLPPKETDTLEDWLLRNEKANKSVIVRPRKDGSMPRDAKLAKLVYRHIGDTDRYHLIEVELLTGRHHQIRCQLSSWKGLESFDNQ